MLLFERYLLLCLARFQLRLCPLVNVDEVVEDVPLERRRGRQQTAPEGTGEAAGADVLPRQQQPWGRREALYGRGDSRGKTVPVLNEIDVLHR